MTFQTYYETVVAAVFPEGEAENLSTRHRNAVIDALIDLQRKVKCLREGHCEVTLAEDAQDVCNASVVQRNPGTLTRVAIVNVETGCGFFRPEHLEPDAFDVYVRDNSACVAAAYAALDAGVTPPPPIRSSSFCETAAESRPVLPGAPRCAGYYTFDQNSIRVFPPLMEGEGLLQQWNGIKRDWQDGEDMGVLFPIRDVMKAAELFVESDAERFEAKDGRQAGGALALYNVQVADLIYTCRRNAFPVPELEIPQSLSPTPKWTTVIYYGKSADTFIELPDKIERLPSVSTSTREVLLEFPATENPEWAFISIPVALGLGEVPEGFVLADDTDTPVPMATPDSTDPYGSFMLNGYWFMEHVINSKVYRTFRTDIAYVGDLAIRIQ